MRLVGFSSVALIGVERGVADLRAIPVTAGLPRSHTALGRLQAKNVENWCALIPSLPERDSRRRFPRRGEYDSPWQTRRGLPWRLRFEYAGITSRANTRAGEAV